MIFNDNVTDDVRLFMHKHYEIFDISSSDSVWLNAILIIFNEFQNLGLCLESKFIYNLFRNVGVWRSW